MVTMMERIEQLAVAFMNGEIDSSEFLDTVISVMEGYDVNDQDIIELANRLAKGRDKQ